MTKRTTRPVGNPFVVVVQVKNQKPYFFSGTMRLPGFAPSAVWDSLGGARLFRKEANAQEIVRWLGGRAGVSVVRYSEAEGLEG